MTTLPSLGPLAGDLKEPVESRSAQAALDPWMEGLEWFTLGVPRASLGREPGPPAPPWEFTGRKGDRPLLPEAGWARPGPLFEGNPVGEGTTRRGTDTPVYHPEKPAGYKHSSTSGLSPHEQLERQVEFHSSTQVPCGSLVQTAGSPAPWEHFRNCRSLGPGPESNSSGLRSC